MEELRKTCGLESGLWHACGGALADLWVLYRLSVVNIVTVVCILAIEGTIGVPKLSGQS